MTMSDDSPSWLRRLGDALLREPKDREQLLSLLHDAEERNLLNADSLKMIEGVLQISERQVRDIMVPRSEMVVLEYDQSLQTILPIVIQSAHSRFPVIGDNRDEVEGILLAKDLLPFQADPQLKFDLTKLIRQTLFVPESQRLDILLHEFKKQRSHLAIVVDEYGGVSGLITIEDILEEIVGDIDDEYDTEEDVDILPKNKNQFLVKATTTIEDFNEYFNIKLDDSLHDTIGGLVMQSFGRVPKPGEITILDGIKIKVMKSDGRRLGLLRVSYKR